MSAPTPAPTRSDALVSAPAWGIGEVAIALVATLVVQQILAAVILAAAGVEVGDGQSVADVASLPVIALLQTTLWVGMLGSIVVVLRRWRVSSPIEALGLRIRALDVPLGIALGVACQLILVPLVSWPWTTLLGKDSEELREPACKLAEKADDHVGIALLFLITVIGAPIVEELFFRGFTQRAAVARLGRPIGLVATAVLFGLTHFQLLQLPALIVFGLVLGLLADRTRRLGSSIVTHMAFNATTVVTLVLLSSSDAQCATVLGLIR
ncbi:MAG: CPBP family intramembrane glutamic endopeptidase [Iamia sp.]